MKWFEIKKPIIALAPMADYTDTPFCRIVREVSGNNFVIFREMVSSEAIVRENAKTLKMGEFSEIERPIVLQVFGSNPEIMSKAVKIIQTKFKPDGIDINMGCPVPKITQKNQAGAGLMKDPDKAIKIIKKIKQDNPEVVLSVKTRLGWSNREDVLEFAPKLEKAGVQLLTIHGRTKIQGYSGQVDWDIIGRVKKMLSIPVIANGDITIERHRDIEINGIEECLKITKADGVMIGRGALGNPGLFSDVMKYERHKITKNRNLENLRKIVLRHAKYHIKHYGENSMPSFRKHLLWYFKSDRVNGKIKNLKKLRAQLVSVKSLEELKIIFKNLS